MKAVGKLSHSNIVQATDAGMEDGTHYLVMELVDGSDLSKLVTQRGRLPVAEACELIRQAAEGLQHAHKNGLVHRDIKPSNLMLTTNGSVKILDLGLALLGGVHHEGVGELTTTGQIMGTIDYMAPEQGSDTHNVDIRADVYSLGATLFKLLTGKAPFEGEQYKTPIKKLMALANVEPPRVDTLRPEVPKALADLVQRMLSKSPKERPTPPSELSRLLEPFAQGADLSKLLTGDAWTPPQEAPSEQEQPAVGGSTAATILVDTDVSQTLDAVPAQPVAQVVPTEEPSFPTIVETSQPRVPMPRSRSWVSKNLDKVLMAGGLIALLMGVIVFRFVTRDGTVYIELPDGVDNVTVTVDGEAAEIDINGRIVTLSVDPGTHRLVLTTPDGIQLTTDNDTFNLAAGGEQQITARLEIPAISRPADDGDTQLASIGGADFALQFDGVDDYVRIPGLQY